jgi:hypothetical protein
VTTSFSKIVAEVVALLESAPAVSANVYRARSPEVPEQCADAVNVYFEGATPNEGAIHGAPVDWRSRIVVECYTRTSTQTADVAIDSLIEKVFEKLAADTTLGGTVAHIGMPEIDTEYNAAGQRTGWVRMTYTVEHRTSNDNLD